MAAGDFMRRSFTLSDRRYPSAAAAAGNRVYTYDWQVVIDFTCRTRCCLTYGTPATLHSGLPCCFSSKDNRSLDSAGRYAEKNRSEFINVRRRRRRGSWDYGGVSPHQQPTRGSGELHELPLPSLGRSSRRERPFSTFWASQNALGEKKIQYFSLIW